MTPRRREFPSSVKRTAYERCKDAAGTPRCESCTAPLRPGHFRYDHDKADALGGAPTIENCKVICDSCDHAKTYTRDIPTIARVKRKQEFHIGARTPAYRPMPGSRASGIKLPFRGGPIDRVTGQPWGRR